MRRCPKCEMVPPVMSSTVAILDVISSTLLLSAWTLRTSANTNLSCARSRGVRGRSSCRLCSVRQSLRDSHHIGPITCIVRSQPFSFSIFSNFVFLLWFLFLRSRTDQLWKMAKCHRGDRLPKEGNTQQTLHRHYQPNK